MTETTVEPDDTTTATTDPGTPTEAPDGPVQPPEADNTTEDADDDHGTGREAAKWRRRFREQESETKAIADRLEAMQRQHVEAITERAGIKPAALWATVQLADLIAEDGTVHADTVKRAVDTARDTLGIRVGLYVPAEGQTPADPGKPNARQQWDNAFRPPAQNG